MSDNEQAAQPTLPQIGVNTQYIKDFSIENPNAPAIFAPTQAQPEMNMGVNVQTKPLAENTHEVILMLRLEARLEGKVAFIAELAYAGVFVVPPMSEEQLRFVLMAESPRHLFPFARSVLCNAIRDAGFPQVLINPIDFYALYQANAAKAEEAPKAEA
jgi:preprotein translocase subunit SecB